MDRKKGKRFFSSMAAALAALTVIQLACSLSGGASPQLTQQPAQASPTPQVAATGPKPTPADGTIASSAEPTATQQKASVGSGGGFACFGSALKGVTCLTDAGWQTYTASNSDLPSDAVNDMAVCSDGKIYAAAADGLGAFDGTQWQSIPFEEASYLDYIACAPDGSVWVGYFKGVAQYKDGAWKTFANTQFDSEDTSGSVNGLDIAPDGTVWVLNDNSVSSYDGKAWKEYKQGAGFDEHILFVKLTVDTKGIVWAASSFNLYRFEKGTWAKITVNMKSSTIIESLAVDPQGRVWVNTDAEGALIYDGSKWLHLSYPSGEIQSNGVYFAAFDDAGRTWLGETYGIDIQIDGAWTHYRMDNADLVDNDLPTLAVSGKGPALPSPMTKKSGSIIGSLTTGGLPVAGAQMEICVEKIIMYFTGLTPCSGQPFMKPITTGTDGKFSITDLPVGYYVLTLKLGDGSWTQLGEMSSDRVLVQEGQETDLGELKTG